MNDNVWDSNNDIIENIKAWHEELQKEKRKIDTEQLKLCREALSKMTPDQILELYAWYLVTFYGQ